MSIKQSIALRKRWANVSPEKRKEQMSALARRKQQLLTPQEKKKHAFTMVKAKRILIGKKKR